MRPEQRGVFLRLLINRAHGSVTDASLKSLPPEEASLVKQCEISSGEIEPLLTHAKTTLPTIHYSWLYKEAKGQNTTFLSGISSCLAPAQSEGFCRMFQIPPPKKSLSPFLKRFYLHHIYRSFPLLSESLPLEYLPESPMNALLKLSKTGLVELIDNLGMFDLAHEMKTIVATAQLKTLYALLSAKQQQFLRVCMHAKDRLNPKKLGLHTFHGDPKELLRKLHKRGIARLALALSGQHKDLIWAIVHRLDSGRGSMLKKMIRAEAVPSVTDAVIQQVETAIKGNA